MTEDLKWLKGAQTAPSAHNTQPWRFRILEDGRIRVEWAKDRELTVADPDSRDLHLALGAAVEAARLKSGHEGQFLKFQPSEENEPFIGHLVDDKEQTALSDFESYLAGRLEVRQTARLPHLPVSIESVVPDMQKEAAEHGCKVHVTQDKEEIQKLARLSRIATADQFANQQVHEELCRWLRLDKHDPAYKRDGLTADCLNLDGTVLDLSKFLMAPATMRVLSMLQLHNLLAMDTQMLVARSQSLVLITTPTKLRSQLVHAGRLLLRIWLNAAGNGYFPHPVSALLDCHKTIWPTAEVFGVKKSAEPAEHPVAIFRLGAVGADIARAPRLPISELLLY